MSTNEWQSGTIKLPTAEFARVRQTLQDADNKTKQEAFDLTQSFWKSLTRKQATNMGAYHDALSAFEDEQLEKTEKPSRGWWGGSTGHIEIDYDAKAVVDKAVELLRPGWGQDKPTRVLKSAVNFSTNRTIWFDVGGEAGITFNRDESTVTWNVPSNNHAVEDAHDHPMPGVLFGALSTVKWTRGTGGVISGSNENRFEHDGNEPESAYGPLGALEAPRVCLPYVDSKGKRVTAEMLAKIASDQAQARFKAERQLAEDRHAAFKAGTSGDQGRDRIGRFAEMHRSEPRIRL